MMDKTLKAMMRSMSLLAGVVLLTSILPQRVAAQDQNDPSDRVARLGYMQGSISFQPAGEQDWVQGVPNRPMTTGDQLWSDQNSRAEVELGYAVIRLGSNTAFSFLNLDDLTTQVQLTSGSLNITVRQLNPSGIFEVDTPIQAFSILRPGHYRIDASPDGTTTVVSVRDGEGEATGAGQTYALVSGDKGTFSGTDSLDAEVVDIGSPDQFDNWASSRDRRRDGSLSAQYLSHDVVGYEDLDDYGDWRNNPTYGHVWFPTQVPAGWAPYRDGHWDWISPWGWTWVDDASWGYAPFHYGRWVTVGGSWGWVAGPVNVAPVYAPALVVFVGAGGIGSGGNVGWFPLGPREVYVPSYNVSPAYMNRVNVSNTTVNSTTITNVYNTTIINKSTTITNVVYVNKEVAGAVTVVPQRAFVSAQPVAKVAVAVNAKEMASVSVSSRAAVAPSPESVLGLRGNAAGHVAAPPPAVANRQVVAKAPPPPPPVPFAKEQKALEAHPGQPLARQEVQTLRSASAPNTKLEVKLAPPGKLVMPPASRQGKPPENSNGGKPAGPPAVAPANRPGNPPAPNGRPEVTPPEPKPAAPNGRPEINPQEPKPPAPRGRPEINPPEPKPPAPNGRPEINPPEPKPPAPNVRPEPNSNEPTPPSKPYPPNERPQQRTPPPAKTGPPPEPPQGKPLTPEDKKRQDGQVKGGGKPGAKPLTPEEKKRQDAQPKVDDKPTPPQ